MKTNDIASAAARPLAGKRVVVTRASHHASELAVLLQQAGAETLEIPVIKRVAPDNHQEIVDVIAGLGSYDWLVFTSANGVEAFFEFFFKAFDDLRDLGGARLAAVGPATAARLQALHLRVDLMPKEYRAAEVAKAFEHEQSIENQKIALLRAQVATRELPEALEELGAIVDDVAVYKTVAETADPQGAGARLQAEGADWITFASGSAVEHFHARFDLPALLGRFPGMRLASIGPETTKSLTALKLKPQVEAQPHTLEALCAALRKAS